MKNSKNQGLVIAGIGVAVFVLAFAGIMLTRNAGKSAKTVSTESAAATIEKYVKKIGPAQAPVVKSPVELADTSFRILIPTRLPSALSLPCTRRSFPHRKNAERERTAGSMRWRRDSTGKALRWTGSLCPS